MNASLAQPNPTETWQADPLGNVRCADTVWEREVIVMRTPPDTYICGI